MAIFTIIPIVAILIFIIVYFIIKSVKKAIFITFTIFFIFSLIIVAVVISDAKNLSKLQTSNSLFIYEKEDIYKSAVSIDFLESKPTTFTEEEISILMEEFTHNKEPITNQYFKIFTFTDQSIENLLSDEISITEGVNFTKKEISNSLNSESQEDIDSAFTVSILSILNNLQDKEKLSIFLNEHREKRLTITPPIKAISLLSSFPKSFVDSILQNT